MRKRLRITAEYDVHVIQLAIHLNTLSRDGEKIICWRPFFLRTVLWVGHHEELVLQLAEIVVGGVSLGNDLSKIADNGAQVFTGGNHAPAANGMETNGNRTFR